MYRTYDSYSSISTCVKESVFRFMIQLNVNNAKIIVIKLKAFYGIRFDKKHEDGRHKIRLHHIETRIYIYQVLRTDKIIPYCTGSLYRPYFLYRLSTFGNKLISSPLHIQLPSALFRSIVNLYLYNSLTLASTFQTWKTYNV